MKSIKDFIKQIKAVKKMVGGIVAIAEQTELLALNASIETALPSKCLKSIFSGSTISFSLTPKLSPIH